MVRTVKNGFIYYAVRLAVTVLGLTPQRLVPALGVFLGRVGYRVARFESRLASDQMAAALAMEGKHGRIQVLTRGVFRELGHSVVELARLLRSPGLSPPVEVSAHSRRVLERALAKKKGVIYVTGHIGNWELMAVTLARMGYPISTVARTSYDPRFTRWIDRSRRRFGVEVIYRHRKGAAAAMLRSLRGGRVLGLLIDQDTSVPGVFVPFFHKPAYTPVGAGAMARRTGAPVVVGTIRRSSVGIHHIDIEDLEVPTDAAEATRVMTRCLEYRIRRHPSQWVWFHSRWKTRPAQEEA
jgi:KDO2-lipid IV(A) lauroyltransferase